MAAWDAKRPIFQGVCREFVKSERQRFRLERREPDVGPPDREQRAVLHARVEQFVADQILQVDGSCGMLRQNDLRSEEHTSELQSLMRISYAVFCLKKKKQNIYNK